MTVSGVDGEGGRLMADLVGAAAEGVVVVDGEGRCLYANAMAQRLLQARRCENLNVLLEDETLHVTRWPFTSAGRDLTAMFFYESERVERQLRQVAAFARTASRIACRRPLQDVLDLVALEARNATGATACSVILLDPETLRVQLVGNAGHAEDYRDRLMRSVELGAPLASVDAFRTGRPARRTHVREISSKDPRYEPLAAPTEAGGWEDVIAVPALIQGQCVGVLTSFFRSGQTPADDDITFLSALADQMAVAVDNASLVAELQSAADAARRRDLVAMVALTSAADVDRVRSVLQAGAVGYVLQEADPDELLSAVYSTASHQGSPGGPSALKPVQPGPPGHSVLTAREREVLALVGEGRSNQQIATRLAITERTARTHVSNVLRKLGLSSRTQAALWATREGLAPGH